MPKPEFVSLPYSTAREVFTPSVSGEADALYKISTLSLDEGSADLLLRFADDTYTESYMSKLDCKLKVKTIEEQGVKVKLSVHNDAPKDQRFGHIQSNNFRGSHAVVLAYDITDESALTGILDWYTRMSQNNPALKNIPVILVATKADKPAAIDSVERARLVSEWNENPQNIDRQITAHIETSAKDGVNVNAVFHTAASQITARKELQTSHNAGKTREYKGHAADIRNTSADSLTVFMSAHERERKSGLFGGLFTRTRITRHSTLDDIVDNALRENSRSRRVFVNLGWLDELGNKGASCPDDIGALLDQKLNTGNKASSSL